MPFNGPVRIQFGECHSPGLTNILFLKERVADYHNWILGTTPRKYPTAILAAISNSARSLNLDPEALSVQLGPAPARELARLTMSCRQVRDMHRPLFGVHQSVATSKIYPQRQAEHLTYSAR
jgi:hypothetical protein